MLDIPDFVISKTKYFSIEQDNEVPIPGFIVILPLRKLRSVDEFTEEEALDFIQTVRRVRAVMRLKLGIDTVYLFENEDTMHNFHLWMFPRYSWMEKFGSKIESVRPIIEYAKAKMISSVHIKEVRRVMAQVKKYL